MIFDILLYTSLAICVAGLVYKMSTWFTRKVGVAAYRMTTRERIFSAAKGTLFTIFSPNILILLKSLILDVFLQGRVLKESFLRWIMHMLIFWGFILLVLMHAMEGVISEALFTDYYSTVNPYMFLRDLFAFMVIVGVGIAVFRRFIFRVPRLTSNVMDIYSIIIVALIISSGIFLEGYKITSHSNFTRMVEDYAGLDDEEEIETLESYWVEKYGLISPNVARPFDAEILEQGEEVHEINCMECHSRPQFAFTGYTASRILSPVALALDRANAHTILWYLHIVACFVGLAYLPFSKMFHIVATSVNLMAGSVVDKTTSAPANIVTMHAIALDACLHCGTCNLRCSVSVGYEHIGNKYILPSEKIQFLKNYVKGRPNDDLTLRAIHEGIYLCTNCDRCTVVCPAGISLKDLWLDIREELIQKGSPEPLVLSPFSWHRGLHCQSVPPSDYEKPIEGAKKAIAKRFQSIGEPEKTILLNPVKKDDFLKKTSQADQAKTFSNCFSCENCTTVCPVVGNYENPQEAVGLLPHQIMRSLGLGLKNLAIGADMLWYCVTCYQCQEHCPQGVNVTDILYELKNQAIQETFTEEEKADKARA